MTKVRVTSKFHDRTDYTRIYEVGQVYDFADATRVRSIVERGLGVIVEDELPKAEPKEAEQPKAETPKEEAEVKETPKKKPVTKRKVRK